MGAKSLAGRELSRFQRIFAGLGGADNRIIFEDIAAAYLARGAVNEAARAAKNGLAVLRETGFAMWLPRFEAIARGLARWQRQPQVRSYLEEFAMTKRQFAVSPR